MAKSIKVVAETRALVGKGPAGRLRSTGKFPGIVYGISKTPLMVQVDAKAFQTALGSHAGENTILDLEVAGSEPRKVLLQEVQHHPLSRQILHADFHEISMTDKLRVEIPVELAGEPIGVSQDGGTLEHLLRAIEVECLPSDIVESFSVDVTAMKIGESLMAGAIPLDTARYTLITPADIALASVAAPREEAEVAPAAVAGAAEPEVLKEKKEEGAEGEAGKEGAKPGAKDAKAGAKDAKPAAKDAKK